MEDSLKEKPGNAEALANRNFDLDSKMHLVHCTEEQFMENPPAIDILLKYHNCPLAWPPRYAAFTRELYEDVRMIKGIMIGVNP